jgi:serine/threonine protein phosphatase PrpC
VAVELLSQPLCKQGGRDKNQDFEKIHKLHTAGVTLHQFIVADGLGGQGGGEFASKAAVHSVLAGSAMHKNGSVGLDEYFDPEWLTLQFEIAHGNVKQQQQRQPEFSKMATTLVVLMVMDGKAIWGHVGDSRLYLLREGKIHSQTKDHSVPQMLVSSGEIEEKDIRHHPDRNRLLRALGDNRENIQARVHEEETLQEGDVFLLCTDGFWEYVTEEEMLTSLYESANPDDWLKRMESQYLDPVVKEEALREGKEKEENDNYTAIAVWYGEKPSLTVIEDESTNIASFGKKVAFWFAGLNKQLKDEKQHVLQILSERKALAEVDFGQDVSATLPNKPSVPVLSPADVDKRNRHEKTKTSSEKEALDRRLASIRADHPSRHKMLTSRQSFWRFWK